MKLFDGPKVVQEMFRKELPQYYLMIFYIVYGEEERTKKAILTICTEDLKVGVLYFGKPLEFHEYFRKLKTKTEIEWLRLPHIYLGTNEKIEHIIWYPTTVYRGIFVIRFIKSYRVLEIKREIERT